MITYEQIKPYIDKKLVGMGFHPENPDVRIFNYTQQCQFDKAWDDITKQCRGLILNVKTGEVLARPFPKFFNHGEHVEKGWPIPTETPEVFTKYDGSLGILYALNGKSWIATRGSFVSDQAVWATKWFREAMETESADFISKTKTALFEIIYPENRIVVNYNFSGLVHLATIDIATGEVDDMDMWPDPFKKAGSIDFKDISELAALDTPNSEGFVVFYPKANMRMKIKFAEYVRLHRIVTGVNEIAIWEILRDGDSIKSLVEKVPDEFFQWVSSVATRLLDAYDVIADQAEKDYQELLGGEDPHIVAQRASWRKDFAIKAQQKANPGVLFALLDQEGKKASLQIWKMLRPHGATVFKTDIDL